MPFTLVILISILVYVSLIEPNVARSAVLTTELRFTAERTDILPPPWGRYFGWHHNTRDQFTDARHFISCSVALGTAVAEPGGIAYPRQL